MLIGTNKCIFNRAVNASFNSTCPIKPHHFFSAIPLLIKQLLIILLSVSALANANASINANANMNANANIKSSNKANATAVTQLDSVQWLAYEDARDLNTKKPIFVFAEMTFCSACRKMKKEVFVEQDIIDSLNNDFIPASMSTLGIFPNSFDDLMDENGENLVLKGSPGFVIIKNNKYSVFYGFQSADKLRKIFAMVIE